MEWDDKGMLKKDRQMKVIQRENDGDCSRPREVSVKMR
jgi:hypothetical protein